MSDSIYSHKKSYTYLIKFIPTGQVYYGVRTANKVSPEDDLWKKYFTSSKVVKQLLEEHGPESFEFEVRKTFDDPEKARLWEENVLKRMKVVRDDKWLNRTDHRAFEYSEESIEKHKQTCLKKYGSTSPAKSEIVQEKMRQTCMKRYGCDNPFKSEIVKEKHKQTCLKKFGYDSHNQSENVKEKKRQAYLKGYGYDSPTQSEEVKIKMSKSLKKRYRCCQCDYTSIRSWVSRHQKETGHSGVVIQDGASQDVGE